MCLAIPGQILSITDGETFKRTGKVSFGGVMRNVNLAYVPKAAVGDYVMVHVGFALSIVDAEEAAQVFEYLQQLEELGELSDHQADT